METRKLKLNFPLERVNEPMVTRLVTDFDLTPNLLRADVDSSKGGWMVVEVTGRTESIRSAIEWVRTHGVMVDEA
ncbi:MAG: NIL domain-containing protein [Capsulimonadaceae bacterium]